jgi:hypothetical protein
MLPFRSRPLVRTTALVCLAALTSVVYDSAARVTHGFVSYYAAARALSDGRFGAWVYDDAAFGAYVRQVTRSPVQEIFVPNTPTMALFALPLAGLNPRMARRLWLVLSLIALAGSVVWLTTDALEHRARWVPLWMAVAFINPAVLENLRTAQAYLLTLGALTVAVSALSRGRDALAGAVLGVVFALKPTIGPLLLVLLWQRQLRAVLVAAAAALALILATLPGLTLEAWLLWPKAVVAFAAGASTSVTAYQTTTGLLRHLCVPDARWNPAAPADCAPVASLVPLLLIGTAVLVTLSASRTASPRLGIAAGLCLSLLAVPIAEDHQFVVLAIPMFLLIGVAPEQRRWLLVIAGLFLVPERYTWERFPSGWWSLLAYPRLYATWGLWSLTVATMRRSKPYKTQKAGAVAGPSCLASWRRVYRLPPVPCCMNAPPGRDRIVVPPAAEAWSLEPFLETPSFCER